MSARRRIPNIRCNLLETRTSVTMPRYFSRTNFDNSLLLVQEVLLLVPV